MKKYNIALEKINSCAILYKKLKQKGKLKMKIDNLIEQIQHLKQEYGNIEVKVLDYDGEASEIDEVNFDSYEQAICICLPRASYI